MLDKKYKILKPLGKGGEGSVWLAVNIRTYKAWAVKEIAGTQREEAGLWRRFDNEHLLQIVDIINENQKTYLVMEYIKGMTLEQILRNSGRLSMQKTAGYGVQICDALVYLHTRTPPLIHGDVKPANIICRDNGTLVLLDYGSLARAGSVNIACFGTRAYAAPEQFARDTVLDARTDIYSLGVTLYRLFTGRFPGEAVTGRLKVLHRRLWRILQKCMEQCPKQRYSSAGEVMNALEGTCRQRRVSCIIIALLAAGCLAVGNRIPRDGEGAAIREKSYEELLAEGGDENCIKAISSDAGRPEAYLQLLDIYLEDDKFSVLEEEKVWEVLGTSEKGIDTISDSEEISYQLGLAYWYFYEAGGGRKYALPWFRRAAEAPEGATVPAHRLRAKVFLRIGGYYEKLSQKDITGDKSEIYKKYWADLMELRDSSISDVDNNVTQLRLMSEIVTQIYMHCSDFRKTGVTRGQMEKALEEIKNEVEEMDITYSKDSVEPQLCSKIKENISLAEESIVRTFLQEEERGR